MLLIDAMGAVQEGAVCLRATDTIGDGEPFVHVAELGKPRRAYSTGRHARRAPGGVAVHRCSAESAVCSHI